MKKSSVYSFSVQAGSEKEMKVLYLKDLYRRQDKIFSSLITNLLGDYYDKLRGSENKS